MTTNIDAFANGIVKVYKTGHATEHSYRPALQALLGGLNAAYTALNEPKRVSCGAPDFTLYKGKIAVGYVEAKDLPVELHKLKDSNKAQQERYLKALPNLIYTNGLDWQFYENASLKASVSIGILQNQTIAIHSEKFAELEGLLHNFLAQRPQTIKSPAELATMMANKTRLMKDILLSTMESDVEAAEQGEEPSELLGQYRAFKQYLIRDISLEDFADMYAETITYGMFAARLHDKTLETFSRPEAQNLLPKSNPFLRSLFSFIAAADLDQRIAWIIDDLAEVYRAANVAQIMAAYTKGQRNKDPFIHFYETFLAAYNPKKREARGVWYTPIEVVNFIVRAVDEALKSHFKLAEGLADTSTVTIDWETGQTDKKGKRTSIKKEVHRVQVLDPATGTGTFLAEVIQHIAPTITETTPALWQSYVEKDLLPRLHGFELLMASYSMCHMKLDMQLTHMGYTPSDKPPRLGVYLTNSLEEGEAANQTLPFTQWLTTEAKAANSIKRDMPIMCVIGNPPYSGESSNKSEWIMGLMEAYKKEPNSSEKLKEKTQNGLTTTM